MGKLAYNRVARLKNLTCELLDILGSKAVCYFCKQSLVDANPLEITMHHINENHDDNRRVNKSLAHESCHRKYHAKRILHKKQVAQAKTECKKRLVKKRSCLN